MTTNVLQAQVEDYLSDKRGLSPATIYQYRYVLIEVFLPWATEAGHGSAAEIDDRAFQRFTDHLKARKRTLSIHTLRSYLRAVRLFLNWYSVPKGRYKQPKAAERLLDVLTDKEIDALEAAALEERDRLIVRVLAESGVRVAELLGLRPTDLREDRHNHTYAIRVIGKGDREREVPLPKEVFLRLRHYADHGGPKGGLIFNGKRLRRAQPAPLTRSGVDRLMHLLAESAGIDKRVYAHLFRHSYATRMLARGMNPITLQKILGHTSLAMISQTYSHLSLKDKYEAMLATRAK